MALYFPDHKFGKDNVRSSRPMVPQLFPRGQLGDREGAVCEGKIPERWFFNMKVHRPPNHNYAGPQDRCEFDRTRHRGSEPFRQGHTSGSTSAHRKDVGTGDQGRAAKPPFRYRKLAAIKSSPSPSELREQIEHQTAQSIGDSIIFHNIPESYDDTPEEEVVRFCQNYLVGRRVKHVQFAHVHKMEQRFAKDAPIAARFRHTLPPAPTDQSAEPKYRPFPYIPESPKRKLPILKVKNQRKLYKYQDLNSTI